MTKSVQELEQELLQEEANHFKDKVVDNPEDLYAQFFYLFGARYTQLIDKLSVRQAKRVLKALVQYPLTEEMYHGKPLEKEVILLGDRLLQAKMAMIMHHLASDTAAEMSNQVPTEKTNNNNNNESTTVSENN